MLPSALSSHPPNRLPAHRGWWRNARRCALLALLALGTGLTGGCASQAPCLQYEPQQFTRTVSMRGYGSVQVTREALVCTERDELFASR